jgi:hypothetical protein
MKLSIMICVVDRENFFFIISNTFTVKDRISVYTVHFTPKKHKGTGGPLQSAGSVS